MFEVFRADNLRVHVRHIGQEQEYIFHTLDGQLRLHETTYPDPSVEHVRAATEEAEKFLQRERAGGSRV